MDFIYLSRLQIIMLQLHNRGLFTLMKLTRSQRRLENKISVPRASLENVNIIFCAS